MDEPTADRDPLEILAEEFMERQRRGESPSVEEYAGSHPDLAEEIRELFPAISAMERLKARGERLSDGLASLGPAKLERLGDFRIIREIGRGGMGVVFEAEQESLGRRVALKVLPRQALLEHRHLARFRREAKIASRLHHTNIVQVYGVGEQDGFHYYVMQYVRGAGLDKVVRRLREGRPASSAGSGAGEGSAPAGTALETVAAHLGGPACSASSVLSSPAYYRRVAGVGEQAAAALAYAHEQGTLHRDVKPSNLLLDDQGTVWVTDFGLARSTYVPQVTQDGDLTGTLRYLAPERLAGRADERADTYSLGLTLYELLTLQPAYDEADRGALIYRLSRRAPVRPRTRNRAIPRDLETIVLKAIAREPEHRYATTAAMGEDLRRFLDDRPVQARRIGPVGRLWRWCRRNRAVASLAAATFVLVLAVAVVATVGYVRTRSALAREARQRRRAEAVAAIAAEALDRVFMRLGPSRVVHSSLTVGGEKDGASIRMAGRPAISRETAALLEEMLPFYDRLAEQAGDDAALLGRAAAARRRIGDIHQRLGQYDKAVAAYRRAVDLYRALARDDGDEATLRVRTAQAWNELGKVYLLKRRLVEARRAHGRALAILEAIGTPSQSPIRLELARSLYFLGRRVQPEPGAAPPEPSHGPPPPPPEGFPYPPPPGAEPPPMGGGAVVADDNAGLDRESQNRHLARAVAILEDLRRRRPANPEHAHLLALCYREVGALPERDRDDAADKAVDILESLVRDFPQSADYQFDLCETYAAIESMRPDVPERGVQFVEERLRKALALSGPLAVKYANMPEYLASHARICHKLAKFLFGGRRVDEAETMARKALEVQSQLAKAFPAVLTYQVWEAAMRNSLADLLLFRGRAAESRGLMEGAIAQANRLVHDHPDLWYVDAILMDSHRVLAIALRRLGEMESAAKAEAEARRHEAKLHEVLRGRAAPPWGSLGDAE